MIRRPACAVPVSHPWQPTRLEFWAICRLEDLQVTHIRPCDWNPRMLFSFVMATVRVWFGMHRIWVWGFDVCTSLEGFYTLNPIDPGP